MARLEVPEEWTKMSEEELDRLQEEMLRELGELQRRYSAAVAELSRRTEDPAKEPSES